MTIVKLFFFFSVTYAFSAVAALIVRFQGIHDGGSFIKGLLVLQFLPVVITGVLFLYFWMLLIRRARSAYSKDTATLSVKELTFIVYSVPAFAYEINTVAIVFSGGMVMLNTTFEL